MTAVCICIWDWIGLDCFLFSLISLFSLSSSHLFRRPLLLRSICKFCCCVAACAVCDSVIQYTIHKSIAASTLYPCAPHTGTRMRLGVCLCWTMCLYLCYMYDLRTRVCMHVSVWYRLDCTKCESK